MKPLAVEHQENIRRFIKTLNLRHPKSPIIYGCILRGFQRFAIQQSAGKQLSTETVRAWLEERIQRWPLHIVFHRARLVDRFFGLDGSVRSSSEQSVA